MIRRTRGNCYPFPGMHLSSSFFKHPVEHTQFQLYRTHYTGIGSVTLLDVSTHDKMLGTDMAPWGKRLAPVNVVEVTWTLSCQDSVKQGQGLRTPVHYKGRLYNVPRPSLSASNTACNWCSSTQQDSPYIFVLLHFACYCTSANWNTHPDSNITPNSKPSAQYM
jgi:hypothetical protein